MAAIPSLLLAFLLGAPVPAVAVATSEECSTLRAAFEHLLEGSFEVERTFRMLVNGDLKKREVARLLYSAGDLEAEVLEDEVHSKSMVFDNEGKDFALEFDFDCERLRATQGSSYELTSEDGLEVAEFRLDEEARSLVPVSWRLDTTERFLFKRFVIEGRAQYSAFSWQSASGE